jgi:hypothetical protein
VSVDFADKAGDIEVDDAAWRTVIPLGCRNQKCNVKVTTSW